MATTTCDNIYHTIISGGHCTSGTKLDIRPWWRVTVSSYGIAKGAKMVTGAQNKLYDINVHGGDLRASDTLICNLTLPNGYVGLTGSACVSKGLIGDSLDMIDISKLTDVNVVSGGRVITADHAWLCDVTVGSGAKLELHGSTSANRITISSGASVIAYADCELNNITVHSGGVLRQYDRVHASNVWVDEGADFFCGNVAEVIYHSQSPRKPIFFEPSSGVIAKATGPMVTPISMTLMPDRVVKIHVPAPPWPIKEFIIEVEKK